MDKKIIKNLENLNNLNRERIFWLKISAFVVIFCFVIVYNWNFLIESKLIWVITSLGLLLSIIWWYWTMSIIRKLISFKTIETELISGLVDDIKEIKKDIKNINRNY